MAKECKKLSPEERMDVINMLIDQMRFNGLIDCFEISFDFDVQFNHYEEILDYLLDHFSEEDVNFIKETLKNMLEQAAKDVIGDVYEILKVDLMQTIENNSYELSDSD
jgi:hypothetical protein